MSINANIETKPTTVNTFKTTSRLVQVSSQLPSCVKRPALSAAFAMSNSVALNSTTSPNISTSTATRTTRFETIPNLTLYYHPFSPFARKVWMIALEHNLTQYITLRQIVVAPVENPKTFPGWSEHNHLLGKFNPIAKIPTLVVREASGADDDGGGDGTAGEEYAVYDSKIICEYLIDLASSLHSGAGETDSCNDGGPASATQIPSTRKSAAYWKRQSLHRLADQMMDSEILVVYEERMRAAEGIKWEEWIKGMRQKIERGIRGLRDAAEQGLLVARPMLDEAEQQQSNGVRVACAEEVAVACCLGFLDTRTVSWRDGDAGGVENDKLAEWYETFKTRESWKLSRPDVKWVDKRGNY